MVSLDPSEKLLFIYFLSNPLTNIAGVYEISIRRISLDTGIEDKMAKNIMERFELKGKLKYQDGWLALKNFIKYQMANPKIKAGVEAILKECPPWAFEFVLDSLPIDYDSLSHLNINVNENSNVNNKEASEPVKETVPSDFKTAMDFFYKMYEIKFLKKPVIDGAEGKALKSVLSKLPLEEVLQCLGRYIESTDPFYAKQGFSLRYFQTAVKALRVEIRKGNNFAGKGKEIENQLESINNA